MTGIHKRYTLVRKKVRKEMQSLTKTAAFLGVPTRTVLSHAATGEPIDGWTVVITEEDK
jgi:hypothetical protein